jgi:hypothetical protein
MNNSVALAADARLPGAMWVGTTAGLLLYAPTLPADGGGVGACYADVASVPGSFRWPSVCGCLCARVCECACECVCLVFV